MRTFQPCKDAQFPKPALAFPAGEMELHDPIKPSARPSCYDVDETPAWKAGFSSDWLQRTKIFLST